MNITLIDDNQIFCFIFSNMLKNFSADIHVHTLHNGLDALEHFLAARDTSTPVPDILFVDINMPFMDGWEFFDALNTHNLDQLKSTAVYIVSSSTSKSDYERMENYPYINGYLHKPFEKQDLHDIITKHCSSQDHSSL